MPESSKCSFAIKVLAIMSFTWASMAKADITLKDTQKLNLHVERVRITDYDCNPAAMFFRDTTSVSSFGVSTDDLQSSKPYMQQLGTGHTLLSMGANSYTRLNSCSVVWGNAQFCTGTYRNIKWNDCLDYLLISPYMLGDEVGGNLSMRQYTFSGGYAHNLGKWTVGMYADYRAEIAYRNRDPRVKTIVSELNLKPGASYQISERYVVGLNVGINVYNQNCDLEFYNPLNDINTYTLTGLGTYYKRFMGNTNKNSGYSSLGYSAGVQWLPISGDGFSIVAEYDIFRMSQQLRSFNNITLGYTDNDIISASVSYRKSISEKLLLQPRISGKLQSRRGTENLFGTSAGASYNKIGNRSPYSLMTANALLTLPLQTGIGVSQFTIEPGVGCDFYNEKYSEPLRKMCAKHISPQVKLQLSLPISSNWLLESDFFSIYSKAFDKQFVMNGFDGPTTLGESVAHNYSMISADNLGCSISCGVSRSVDKVVLRLAAYYNTVSYSGVDAVTQSVGISIAAMF